MTPSNPPGGPIYGVPPKNFRKYSPDGKLILWILWVFNKWLQGARGAGNATRKLFESYIMTNGEMNFERSVWDPSLYFYHDADGTSIEFTLHGDDGTGCANSITAAHRMKALLESKYPGAVKWWDEHGDMLGFAVKKTAIGTTITAPKHIEALHVFVTNDAAYKPTVPYTKDFMHLLPVAVPEPDTVEWHLFDARVHFMQESGGHIAHITKVRPDIVGAYNMVVRTSHAPCSLALKCMKHLIFYLIATIDIGITIARVPQATTATLVWPEALPSNYLLDVNAKPLQYHVVLDGQLGIDRSIASILHMLGGVAISAQAFRQHSIALSAHDTECFTAATGAAQAITIRGVLHELLTDPANRGDTNLQRLVEHTPHRQLRSGAQAIGLHRPPRPLYMREEVTDGEYAFYQCIGVTNPADVNTKVVTAKAFLAAHRYFMGI